MKRDHIIPKEGDVWEGRNGQRRVRSVVCGCLIKWSRIGYDRTCRCTLATFREWVGAKGKLIHREQQKGGEA